MHRLSYSLYKKELQTNPIRSSGVVELSGAFPLQFGHACQHRDLSVGSTLWMRCRPHHVNNWHCNAKCVNRAICSKRHIHLGPPHVCLVNREQNKTAGNIDEKSNATDIV